MMTTTPLWLLCGFGALVGASTGSFLAVVVERVPAGTSIAGRSYCVCGRQLRGFENVPVLAWLVLRGSARCCGAKIPVWYFAAEVYCAVVGAAVAATRWPWWAQLLVALVGWSVVPATALVRARRGSRSD